MACVRGRRRQLAVLVGVIAALATVRGRAQDAARPAESRLAAAEAASPTPVRLDVVVTDQRGRAIVDLRPADFELLEGGVAQKLVSVELRDGRQNAPVAVAPDLTGEQEEQLARQPGTRVFALVLDEYHVAAGEESARVREMVGAFLDGLRPQDLALVVKPLNSLSALRFTTKREPLRDAIASFAGRKGDLAPRTTFEQQFIGTAPAAVEAARAQIVTAALGELALRIGDLRPARAAIVLVSDGFVRPSRTRGNVRMPDAQGVIRASTRHNIPIYSFSPAHAPEPDSDAGRAAEALRALSSATGGTLVQGPDAFGAGLRRMDEDLTTYYAITYESAARDGRFHPIEVRAKRSGAVVRARTGHWAPLPGLSRPLPETPPPLSRRSLKRSALITAWTGFTRDADGRVRLNVTWEPRSSSKAAAVLVTARALGGTLLFEGKIGRVGESTVGTLGDSARFDVQGSRVELDLSVLGMSGAVLDVDTRDLDVPDLRNRKGPLLFTPQIVRARTLPEYRALSGSATAAPTPTRAFVRSDRLIVRAMGWDPGGQPVAISAQVLNVAGRAMRPIERTSDTPDTVAQFDLPLAWLAPGEYAIELRARSQAGETRELVRFTLR